MKIDRRFLLLILVSAALLFQTGCWDQKIYERIGFILQLGLEQDEKGNLIYTVSIPTVAPDVRQKVEVFTTSKNLLRESREQIRHISGKVVEGGKIQHIYFSKQLAQKGIGQFLEIFVRQTENPMLCNIVVVDGSPKEMMNLSQQFEDKQRLTFYVNDLLRNLRNDSYVPEARISNFTIMEYSKTIDPITPIIKYTDEEIEVTGTSLFKGDKMVGQINTAETSLLNLIMGTSKKVHYMYHRLDQQGDPTMSKEGAAVLIKDIKRKIKIKTDEKAPEIEIKLKCNGALEEYNEAHNLNDPEAKKNLEEIIALSIQRDCLLLLKHLQKTGSDPIGFAEMIRAKHNQYYKSVTWDDVNKEITFNVDVNLTFEFHGAIN